jgi:hypothetical protein
VTLSCTSIPAAADEPLVLVASSKGTLIESFANPIDPLTLCSLSSNASNVKFISLAEIGYTTNSLPDSPYEGVTTIWRMGLKDKMPINVANLQGGLADIEWSPDGSNVAILAGRLWLKVGSALPRALTPLLEGGGREGTSLDEFLVRFSPDGKYLLMINTGLYGEAPKSAAQAMLQVRSVPDGKLVWVPPTALKGWSWTTMGAWSHLSDRLYYYDEVGNGQRGVLTWDAPATVGTLASSLPWRSPSVSLDDRRVAYEVISYTDQKPHVQVRDLVSGAIQALPGIIGEPILLSDEVMIEVHYALVSEGFGAPYYAPGQHFVLNLRTKVETALPASFQPIDVWPH